MTATRYLCRQPAPAMLGFAMRGALTAALLIAAEGHALAHGLTPQAAIQAELASGNADQAVELGEAAVTAAPQDATLRAALGHAYLRAGRFEAAISALHDARALGDSSGHTVLALALAQIACRQNRAALATLDAGLDIGVVAIAPAELGLALALAGDAERGIAVLTDGVRGGLASARLRQNLAYAYALDGRWADAGLTAGFDLPPDQVATRLQQWAQSMQSGGERVRIARLLDVPVAADQGMPAALALNGAEAGPAPPRELATAVAAGELPALTTIPVVEPMAPAPVAAPLATFRAAAAWQPPAHRAATHVRHAVINFDHFVQLGAFSSAQGAERAKLILAKQNPQLGGHGFLITQANVHGRVYWRVATTGFDGKMASVTCAGVKHRGGACFAYAVNHAPAREALALANTHGGNFPAKRWR